MKNTIIVNLFAGPGAGKSTGAAYIFAMLKMCGVDAELVTEFAKDKVWEENSEVFKNQMYVTAKQSFKISRVAGKVDVIVTDSPLLMGIAYADTDGLKHAIIDEYNKYDNQNWFIKRAKPYNPNGRFQTEEQAKEIDTKIHDLLAGYGIIPGITWGTIEGYDEIIADTLYLLDKIDVMQRNKKDWKHLLKNVEEV